MTRTEAGSGSPRERLTFGPFALDVETGRLLEGGRVIPLAPKPFETLHYLASRPGRVVSKSELMEKLWADTFVTDDVLVQSVVEIRRALGDTAKAPRWVQTIPRRGYQFVGDPAPEAPPSPGAPLPSSPAAPDQASAAPAAEPRRRPRWIVATALLVTAVVAAATIDGWRSAVGRVEPTAAAATEPGSLLVMPVTVEEAGAQSAWLREGLAEMIRAQLGQTPGIHVVARHRLAAALGDGAPANPTTATAASIARSLRAEKLLTGSFMRVEDRFVINVSITDVMTGAQEGTATQVRGKYPTDLLDAVDDLCLKLLHQLRPAGADSGNRGFRPTRLATASLDASRHYIEALALFARGGRRAAEEAEAQLDHAARIDPGFAHAYVKKAEIQQWRRRWGYGDPDPAAAVRAAARLMKNLPSRERVLVESFEALIVRNQPDEALKHWSSLLQFYPTYGQEIGVPSLVADTFLRQGRWDELIMVAETHVDSPSLPDGERALLSSYLAQAFRRKGEFVRARQHARRAVALWPGQQGPRFLSQRAVLGRVSLEAGQREEAIQEFRTIASAPGADVTNLTDAAWGLYMAGQADEAAALVDRALELEPSYGNAYHLRGWILLSRGEFARAAEQLSTAFERTPQAFGNPHQGLVTGDLAALYYAGVAWQKAGRPQEARAAFDRLIEICNRLLQSPGELDGGEWQAANFRARAAARLGTSVPEPPRLEGDDTTFYVQSARLHAVRGASADALREIAQGLALGHGEYRHIKDDPDFESLRTHPEFRRLVIERAGS